MLTARFSKLCERLGYKLVPIASKINGRVQRRPDILGVDYHGDFIMVVPRIILPFSNRFHCDLNGIQHPNYFGCEQMLYQKTFSGKESYGKV